MVAVSVTEYRDVPPALRETSPAGARLPAGLGNVFCYFTVVTYRSVARP